MPLVKVIGAIAIVCVLLFWFCYFGILAKLGCDFFSVWVSAQSGRFFSSSFQTVDSDAFAIIIGLAAGNFSFFLASGGVWFPAACRGEFQVFPVTAQVDRLRR
jgi:hypothetical protein